MLGKERESNLELSYGIIEYNMLTRVKGKRKDTCVAPRLTDM